MKYKTEDLNLIMMNAAKEVNKKYEQQAREEGKKEGIEEGKKEGIEEGKKEGIEEGKKEIAKKLKEIFTTEEIAEITGLKIREIRLL